MRRRHSDVEFKPYMANPDIQYKYEYQLSPRILLKPGDIIKVTGCRGTFVFMLHAWNTKLNTEWIDCRDSYTYENRAFRPERISRRVKVGSK